ncbi:MAG: MFS transporter [Gammaproteobacteria bacterium]
MPYDPISLDCHHLNFFAIIINYLDRTALSYAVTPLESQFGLNNSDFGIIAAAFGVGYLIMTVIGGILVDQFGARKIWSGFAILWSLACTGIAFAAAGILAPFLTGILSNLTGNFSAAIGLMIVLTLSSSFAIIVFQHPDNMQK